MNFLLYFVKLTAKPDVSMGGSASVRFILCPSWVQVPNFSSQVYSLVIYREIRNKRPTLPGHQKGTKWCQFYKLIWIFLEESVNKYHCWWQWCWWGRWRRSSRWRCCTARCLASTSWMGAHEYPKIGMVHFYPNMKQKPTVIPPYSVSFQTSPSSFHCKVSQMLLVSIWFFSSRSTICCKLNRNS